MSFSVNNKTVAQLLGYIRNNEIAIPEIQRPFVWEPKKVRDLIDSLYKKYPIGYIIVWNNPEAKGKDGKLSGSKKILIDGQQRITALTAAIVGKEVMDERYKKIRIKISFNPFNDDSPFDVQNPALLKDKKWIPDISLLFNENFNSYQFINDYCKMNEEMKPDILSNVLQKLRDILNIAVGTIELDKSVEIETVTEIFIRINSQGKQLDQADFVMSKLASDEKYNGQNLRKLIDYFCHLAIEPNVYEDIKNNDQDFAYTPYLNKIKWLSKSDESLYDPNFNDLIRVSFMHIFKRSKLSDLVSLLSGRNFETKEFIESIAEESFKKIENGILSFVNEENFLQFTLLIKSMGFIDESLVGSKSALNFAYTLYLYLHKETNLNDSLIKKLIQKWYLVSVLTQRYTSSAETKMNEDLRTIIEKGIESFFNQIEATVLSETYWNLQIIQDLDTTNTKSPVFLVFQAAQIFFNDISLFSTSTTVRELINTMGDVHHIFPKAYLKDNGKNGRNLQNQVANYIYLDSQVNRDISKKPPQKYFEMAFNQCQDQIITMGNILNKEQLIENLTKNCIPLNIHEYSHTNYEDFLIQRRILMAEKIKKYYYSF
jgi:hypothetical protein